MAKNRYLVIEGSASDCAEAITLCADALYQAGLVGERFGENCRIREIDYPTGLPTDIPVAIPHCKDEGITENSICFLKLKQPVLFYRMDNDQESIETNMVFNLAFKDAEAHLEALQSLMRFIGNAEALQVCRELSGAALIQYLEENVG